MSYNNGDRARTRRKNYLRLKKREVIAAFKKTEIGQSIMRGVEAERAKAAASATAPAATA